MLLKNQQCWLSPYLKKWSGSHFMRNRLYQNSKREATGTMKVKILMQMGMEENLKFEVQ